MNIEYAMAFMERAVVHLPMTTASVVLVIAAIGKTGRERGAGLFMIGAVCLCVMSIVSPVFYELIIPKLLDSFDGPARDRLFLVAAWTSRVLWSGAVLCLAVGVFMRRSSRIDQQRPMPPLPNDYQTRL